MKNRTIFQGFEWYLPPDNQHWNRLADQAEKLAKLGFTHVWLPPAYKGMMGVHDVGYGVYDLYDLGEFDAKGSVPTKYGTLQEYKNAIQRLQEKGIRVMADIVLNHRMGADALETVFADAYNPHFRETGFRRTLPIKAETAFLFPGRNGQHSDFKWNHTHFNGVDRNLDFERDTNMMNGGLRELYKFAGKNWSDKVSDNNQNDDFVMGSNVDFTNPEVLQEMDRWGKWYIDMTGIDAVRLDMVRHIRYDFFTSWLESMRIHAWQNHGKTDFLAVGEYWHWDNMQLLRYLNNCGKCMCLFDVPLHYNLHIASREKSNYDLRRIFDNTLVEKAPLHAVTFVDNHDTQPGQSLESWVYEWFRQSAYALILLRQGGLPCVFYGDLYGLNPYRDGMDRIAPVKDMDKLMKARTDYATGGQRDYFIRANTIGWTREGGAAVVISNNTDDWIAMEHGVPGQVFVDILGNCTDAVVIDENGVGFFPVKGRSVSVWVPKE